MLVATAQVLNQARREIFQGRQALHGHVLCHLRRVLFSIVLPGVAFCYLILSEASVHHEATNVRKVFMLRFQNAASPQRCSGEHVGTQRPLRERL